MRGDARGCLLWSCGSLRGWGVGVAPGDAVPRLRVTASVGYRARPPRAGTEPRGRRARRAQPHPVAGLYPLVDRVRERLPGNEAASPRGGTQVPVLQHHSALSDDHRGGSAALDAFEDVVLHVLGAQGRGSSAAHDTLRGPLTARRPLGWARARKEGAATSHTGSGGHLVDEGQVDKPALGSPRPHRGLCTPVPAVVLPPSPQQQGGCQGPPPARPARGLALTRLWLLAEMILVALGFHMTRSASDPTATRPFLG